MRNEISFKCGDGESKPGMRELRCYEQSDHVVVSVTFYTKSFDISLARHEVVQLRTWLNGVLEHAVQRDNDKINAQKKQISQLYNTILKLRAAPSKEDIK